MLTLSEFNRQPIKFEMARDLESKSTKDEFRLTFSWERISYSLKTKSGKKDILRNVSGFLKSGIFIRQTGLIVGEMLAVMGPSGCGKNVAEHSLTEVEGSECRRTAVLQSRDG
jgi:ABC-type glutathione transport system ATPase component